MPAIEVSCTCFPSPPGGTTRCEGGQVAICAADESGECQGRCVTVASDLAPLDYSARLLSQVVEETISADDLEKHSEEYAAIVSLLLDSSNENKAVNFKLKRRSHRVSVGLTDVAKDKLEDALRTLASTREPPTSSTPNIRMLSTEA